MKTLFVVIGLFLVLIKCQQPEEDKISGLTFGKYGHYLQIGMYIYDLDKIRYFSLKKADEINFDYNDGVHEVKSFNHVFLLMGDDWETSWLLELKDRDYFLMNFLKWISDNNANPYLSKRDVDPSIPKLFRLYQDGVEGQLYRVERIVNKHSRDGDLSVSFNTFDSSATAVADEIFPMLFGLYPGVKIHRDGPLITMDWSRPYELKPDPIADEPEILTEPLREYNAEQKTKSYENLMTRMRENPNRVLPVLADIKMEFSKDLRTDNVGVRIHLDNQDTVDEILDIFQPYTEYIPWFSIKHDENMVMMDMWSSTDDKVETKADVAEAMKSPGPFIIFSDNVFVIYLTQDNIDPLIRIEHLEGVDNVMHILQSYVMQIPGFWVTFDNNVFTLGRECELELDPTTDESTEPELDNITNEPEPDPMTDEPEILTDPLMLNNVKQEVKNLRDEVRGLMAFRDLMDEVEERFGRELLSQNVALRVSVDNQDVIDKVLDVFQPYTKHIPGFRVSIDGNMITLDKWGPTDDEAEIDDEEATTTMKHLMDSIDSVFDTYLQQKSFDILLLIQDPEVVANVLPILQPYAEQIPGFRIAYDNNVIALGWLDPDYEP